MIGSLGEFVFEVSEESIKTFDGLKFSHSAKYTEHAIHGKKGLLEYVGMSASSCSLTIKLSAYHGVNPDCEIAALRAMMDEPQAFSFILDGEIMGENLWVIESMEESRGIIDNRGGTIVATVNLRLKEYL